jgi:hypothetical protein
MSSHLLNFTAEQEIYLWRIHIFTGKRGRILGRNWDQSLRVFLLVLFTVTFTADFTSPHPPIPRAKVVCKVNILYGNLKSENSHDYAWQPQLFVHEFGFSAFIEKYLGTEFKLLGYKKQNLFMFKSQLKSS